MTVRDLDTATLDNAARDYAAQFLLPTMDNPHNPAFAPIGGRGWVMNSLYNLHFKDEFAYLLDGMRREMGARARKEFDDLAAARFTPRSDDVLAAQLAERLAITPDGKTISGKIGKVKRDQVTLGFAYIKTRSGLQIPRVIHADVHIGETTEEAAERVTALHASHGVIIFPLYQMPPVMALNTRISNTAAKRACDAIVDSLDDGTGAAIIQCRTGAQPTDPDTAVGGTLLGTLVCSDPAFGNAADANPGGRATASSITSDSSADATGTLGYCRAFSSNDGATPLTAHIDGEAGTSGADFNFNTLAFVSGATIAISSWTVTMPES